MHACFLEPVGPHFVHGCLDLKHDDLSGPPVMYPLQGLVSTLSRQQCEVSFATLVLVVGLDVDAAIQMFIYRRMDPWQIEFHPFL